MTLCVPARGPVDALDGETLDGNGGGDDVSEAAYAAEPESAGDGRGAFEDLLREQRRPLRRMVEQVSGAADPDDVEQEFVLRAFQHRGRVLAFDSDDRCRWSRTVARNIAFKMFRTAGDVELVAQVPGDALVAPDVLDLHVAAEERARLLAALAELDPETQQLVIARAVNRERYGALGERFDASAATLRARYARALERLRASLAQAALMAVPARWVFRPPSVERVARFGSGFPAAVSTVMVGVLALTLGLPGGAGPLATPPAEAAMPALRLEARPPASTPPDGVEIERAAAGRTPSRSGTASAIPPKARREGDRAPKGRAWVCVNDHCASVPGDPDQPGDELFVDAPEPVGRVGLQQGDVPACDVVPNLGPAGCERHG